MWCVLTNICGVCALSMQCTGSRLIQVADLPLSLPPAFQLRRRTGVVTGSSPTRQPKTRLTCRRAEFHSLLYLGGGSCDTRETGPCMLSGAAGLCLLSTNFTDNRSWLGDSTLANKPKLKTNTCGTTRITSATTTAEQTSHSVLSCPIKDLIKDRFGRNRKLGYQCKGKGTRCTGCGWGRRDGL